MKSEKKQESFLGMDEQGEVYMECCVYVLYEQRFVMGLGSGTDAVIRFSEWADEGIPGTIQL